MVEKLHHPTPCPSPDRRLRGVITPESLRQKPLRKRRAQRRAPRHHALVQYHPVRMKRAAAAPAAAGAGGAEEHHRAGNLIVLGVPPYVAVVLPITVQRIAYWLFGACMTTASRWISLTL